MAAVCRRVGMSRQNYYAGRKHRQARQIDEQLILALVQQERQLQPRLGTRKLHFLLQRPLAKAGVKLGRDRFFELLRQRGLLLERRPSAYPRTTNSYHTLPVFQNRIKDLAVSHPNEVWVADLTYLRTEEGFLYLSLITDKYSRNVVGHDCGDTLETVGCLRSLNRALADLPDWAKPIHHSDRGCQFCSHAYVDRLREAGLGVSMTELDHCAENALAERVNGILKQEYELDRKFKTKKEAMAAVEQAIWLYNTRRPHTELGYRFPAQVHQSFSM